MPVDDVRKRTLEPPVIINMVIIVFYTAVTLWASWQLWKAAKAVGGQSALSRHVSSMIKWIMRTLCQGLDPKDSTRFPLWTCHATYPRKSTTLSRAGSRHRGEHTQRERVPHPVSVVLL